MAGGGDAVGSITRYYLSLDTLTSSTDKLLSGKRSVPPLAPDATSTGLGKLTVGPSTKVGVYYLLACADVTTLVDEGNETNNCLASSTTVDVRAPDLVETSVSNPPATASPGNSFPVTDSVINQGIAAAVASTTRYYLSLDAKKSAKDPLLTGTRAVPALDTGANSTNTVTVTIAASTPSGAYYLLACADDLKKAAESIEANNCKKSTAKVTVSPNVVDLLAAAELGVHHEALLCGNGRGRAEVHIPLGRARHLHLMTALRLRALSEPGDPHGERACCTSSIPFAGVYGVCGTPGASTRLTCTPVDAFTASGTGRHSILRCDHHSNQRP